MKRESRHMRRASDGRDPSYPPGNGRIIRRCCAPSETPAALILFPDMRTFVLSCTLAAAALTVVLVAQNKDAAVTDIHLMTLDPGHFHAALIQKDMYPGVAPRVDIYAP